MRRTGGVGVSVGSAAMLLAGAARAAEPVVAAPAPGGALLMFGVATLVPAVAVYAFFRQRELKGVPEAPVKARKEKAPKPAKLKRLPKVKANPVAAALEAKVVATAALPKTLPNTVPNASPAPVPGPDTSAGEAAQQPA